jgi:hypothetical protein
MSYGWTVALSIVASAALGASVWAFTAAAEQRRAEKEAAGSGQPPAPSAGAGRPS